MAKLITMIDYGASNIRSAQKAFEFVGAEVRLTDDPDTVRTAEKIVLPGVGAFGAGMDRIRSKNLHFALKEAVENGTPLLGICLGMQFLFDGSNEMGKYDGLGLIKGQVTRFNLAEEELKVPHMGWNQIIHDETHPLLRKVPTGAHTYFVHSYYCAPEETNTIIAHTEYGDSFPSIVGQGHVFGIQFHPEKSQKRGLQILENYVNLI